MRFGPRLAGLAIAAGIAVAGPAGADTDESDRGALLYATHCVGCHTAQVHWRDARRVVSWATLEAEVRRWQSNGGLGWSDDDVAAVARYLNGLYYRLPVRGAVARHP